MGEECSNNILGKESFLETASFFLKMKNHRIGILTYHYAVNPGSALQAYGLWRTINSLDNNIECFIINYHSMRYRKMHMHFPKRTSITSNIIQLLLMYSYLKFQRFWRRQAGAVKPKHWLNEDNLKDVKGYECIVAGSDQIWNTELTNKNFYYFLPFISGIKKISYAASIGLHDFPEEDKDVVKELLNDFDYISVREPEGQDAIEKLMGKRPELLIDPSLLLDKNQYESLAKRPKNKRKYIFLYLRHKNSEVVPYAREMANAKNLQIVECHGGIRKISSEDKRVWQPTPEEWIGWILNAEYVFTDSFHGCAFCINLNKQFFVKISSANSEMSSRIYHILDKYGMKNRMIEDVEKMQYKSDIDFTNSNVLLVKERKKSLEYLRKALEINSFDK